MGLMTMLTGKDRHTRQLETIDRKTTEMVKGPLGALMEAKQIDSGETYNLWEGSLKFGICLNTFVTHYVRTQRPENLGWAARHNFDEEGPALVSYALCCMKCLKDVAKATTLPIAQCVSAAICSDQSGDIPNIEVLLDNMFKNVPLGYLLDSPKYKDDAIKGVEIFSRMYKAHAAGSELDHDVEMALQVINYVSLTN